MFDPMYVHESWDQWGQLILLGISIVLAAAGMYWIYRITKDIEDN